MTDRHIANQSLELLDCSPIKVIRTDRTVSLGKRKINDFTTKFNQTLAVALDEPSLAISVNKDCDNCEKLMKLIKEKVFVSDRDQAMVSSPTVLRIGLLCVWQIQLKVHLQLVWFPDLLVYSHEVSV